MTTGPQHYRDAERLADRAQHFTYGDGADPVVGNALATEALARATLALAAATVLAAVNADSYPRKTQEWLDAIAPPKEDRP